MPCDVDWIGGSWVFLCGPTSRRIGVCVGCDARASLLCDGPGRNGRTTCDAPICRACAKAMGRNLDLCPGCAVITSVVIIPGHGREAEWLAAFGDHPVRVVWPEPRGATPDAPKVWRLHVAQIEIEQVSSLVEHLARKHGHPNGLLFSYITSGKAHPTVEAGALRICP